MLEPSEHIVILLRKAICDFTLDLSGLTVYTEAATGAYAVAAPLAALANAAHVYALARGGRFGTAAKARAATESLAESAGVKPRVVIVTRKRRREVGKSDIVTNSGHVRPIDSRMIAWMKPTAVIPLMYAGWEFRAKDLDLDACSEKGIAVAGTAEDHPLVRMYEYIGILALKLMLDHGCAIFETRVAVLSDNVFGEHIHRTLGACGARSMLIKIEGPEDRRGRFGSAALRMGGSAEALSECEAILVAAHPRDGCHVIGDGHQDVIHVGLLKKHCPGARIFELCWGGALDRAALEKNGFISHPRRAAGPYSMSVLPSELGVTPIVRLQAASLKVGEILARQRLQGCSVEEAIQAVEKEGLGGRLLVSGLR